MAKPKRTPQPCPDCGHAALASRLDWIARLPGRPVKPRCPVSTSEEDDASGWGSACGCVSAFHAR